LERPKGVAIRLKFAFRQPTAHSSKGDVVKVSYNDSVTPTVTCTWDRRSRRQSMGQTGTGPNSSDTMTWKDADRLTDETFSGGPLGGLSMADGYDILLRHLHNLSPAQGTRPTHRQFPPAPSTNSATTSQPAASPQVQGPQKPTKG
jgi:hypothetical protein